MPDTRSQRFVTAGGVEVTRHREIVDADAAVDEVIAALGGRTGCLLSSQVDFPGKYARFDLALVDPPVSVIRRAGELRIVANTARGQLLKDILDEAVTRAGAGAVPDGLARDEEYRTRRSPLFAALRAIRDTMASGEDEHLGLYGAFGYDLVFELEPIIQSLDRAGAPDLVLHVPDRILVVDRKREHAEIRSYDFAVDGRSTAGLDRPEVRAPYVPADVRPEMFRPGSYASVVEKAKDYFVRGDLFEVVPGHVLEVACDSPEAFYRRLMSQNPAPYSVFMNLGYGEFLVGASPEMFVRVVGDRVESCPISGTVRRGASALEDAARTAELINSVKDETELTMCTDVDRNDKSRVCVPGSVRVIGRRELEYYSRLIHTVDHVEGRLRPDLDALDAFASHMWAVTVTGAPKRKAIEFIEAHEQTARGWYGGAVGALLFNGDINTGITLRTASVRDGMARIRAGATLLNASDAADEEAETLLKASALIGAAQGVTPGAAPASPSSDGDGDGLAALVVDFDDSFVNTLADYFRQTGAQVRTVRWNDAARVLAEGGHDLVVLSPGPGTPAEFGMHDLIAAAARTGTPQFGVCLGMQGLAEYAGARLTTGTVPMHGVASDVLVRGDVLFDGLPDEVRVGRYHSLVVEPATLPDEVRVTGRTEDGVVMALEIDGLNACGVQFHPESIMTARDDHGLRLIGNVVRWAAGLRTRSTPPSVAW